MTLQNITSTCQSTLRLSVDELSRMDYSSLPNDPDHPVGSSPWQSSPQPTSRPNFNASETGSSDQDIHDRRNTGENVQPILPDAIETSQPNGNTQGSSNGMQSPPLMQQPPQSQPQQQSRQPQNQQARGAPNRYHGGANRNVQRQNIPQYKLQAKVTSLERTGRKDPVLRFDVHVSLMHSLTDCKTPLIFFPDQSARIQNKSISGCPADAFRILETRRPPDIVKPGSFSSCGSSTVNSSWCRYRRG